MDRIASNLGRTLGQSSIFHTPQICLKTLYLATPLVFNPPTKGFPWDDLRKIFIQRSLMVKVPHGVETLPKISIA